MRSVHKTNAGLKFLGFNFLSSVAIKDDLQNNTSQTWYNIIHIHYSWLLLSFNFYEKNCIMHVSIRAGKYFCNLVPILLQGLFTSKRWFQLLLLLWYCLVKLTHMYFPHICWNNSSLLSLLLRETWIAFVKWFLTFKFICRSK